VEEREALEMSARQMMIEREAAQKAELELAMQQREAE
jgi:hypothetical protein